MERIEGASKFDDYVGEDDELQVDEYDITVTPNDFNVITLSSFIELGAVKIPGFQRNFVWDIRRASKLIESLIVGLPVPQIFLYEAARNNFLVIDGQQRLMSIYYFINKKFPRKEKRTDLRRIFAECGKIPESVFHDEKYFQAFNLRLPDAVSGNNKFNGLNYATMDEYKTQFDLRPIRNIIVKQNSPSGSESSIYEIFNRLNTGGVNLRQQEIRACMFHSDFYVMLDRVNGDDAGWREILDSPEPDLNLKDMEVLLRGFAMLINGESYSPSMLKFLNRFSQECKMFGKDKNAYLEALFRSFVKACDELPKGAFINKRNNRFNIALYEAVFAAVCKQAYEETRMVEGKIESKALEELETDETFTRAALEGTTRTSSVHTRLKQAREIIGSL